MGGWHLVTSVAMESRKDTEESMKASEMSGRRMRQVSWCGSDREKGRAQTRGARATRGEVNITG